MGKMDHVPAAERLVRALETLTNNSQAQQREAEQARERADRWEHLFETRMKSRIEGEPLAPIPESELMSSFAGDDLRAEVASSEAAYLDAFHALMHLWADPPMREAAEQVFGLLRESRLVALDPDDISFAAGMPEFHSPNPAEGEDQRKAMLESMLQHHERMSNFMEDRLAKMEEEAARSTVLLARALEIARTMAGQA